MFRRREVRAADDQVLAVTEFFHPRIEEMAGLLPRRLGETVERSAWLARLVDRGRKLRTTAPSSFLLLYCVAGLRRFRRHSLRHAREMRHLDEWAERIRKFAASDVARAERIAGVAIAGVCARRVKARPAPDGSARPGTRTQRAAWAAT